MEGVGVDQQPVPQGRRQVLDRPGGEAPAVGGGRAVDRQDRRTGRGDVALVAVSERLMAAGVLAKDTHGTTIRLAPPLVISQDDLDWALDKFESVIR